MSPGDVYLFHSCVRVKLSIINSNYTYDSNATTIGCSEKSKKSQIVIRATESVIIEKVLAPFEISVRSNASVTIVEQLQTKELFNLKAPGVIQMLNLNLANQILSISEAKNVTFSNSFIEESTFTIRGTPNDSQSRVEFRNTRMSDVTWRAMLVNNIVVRDQSDIDLKISGKDSQNLKTFCCSTTLNVSSNSYFTDDVFPGKSCDDCKKRDTGQNFEKMINATKKNDIKAFEELIKQNQTVD